MVVGLRDRAGIGKDESKRLMAKTEFKLVRKPKSPKVQYDTIRREVVKKLEPVAEAAVIARRRVVANWKHKPDFAYKISVKPDTIRVIINLTRPKKLESGTADTNTLWRWINKGTKAHKIPKTPKVKGTLAFKWGGKGSYKSKTGARPARYGGPGTVSGGKLIFPKQVQHPGFPGREFEEAINKDLRPKFNQAVDSGYRAGFRKLRSR